MSTKIQIPDDRTIKQPSKAFCRNPKCRTDGKEFVFKVEHADVECPKCGADRVPMVGMLTMTHLLVPDPKGPVRGQGGLTYKMACESDRAYLATATNLEAATDNPKVVTCDGCLSVAEKLKITKPTSLLTPETVTKE